jgi:hypothetical protein
MKITALSVYRKNLALTKPYTIAPPHGVRCGKYISGN